MRIITLNVNGIRAAGRKGFFPWLRRQKADVVCLQEVRASGSQISEALYHPRSFHCHYLEAEKKGYSGVALFSRRRPDRVIEGFGWPDVDSEGRYLEAQFPGLSVVSLYIPSGTSGDARQAFKMDFLARFRDRLASLANGPREYLFCGDINIAHKNIDIRNWRSNQKNSGFLPEERAWLDEVFGPVGLVDSFRMVNQAEDQYTWWSNRGQAWAKNVGWRIDYQITTPGIGRRATAAKIYKARRFSDHAPLIIDYDFQITE